MELSRLIAQKRVEQKLKESSHHLSGNRYYGGLPSEPSASEYGEAISNQSGLRKLLDKYNIEVSKKGVETTYQGYVNDSYFIYVETQRDISHYATYLEVNDEPIDLYKSVNALGWSITGSNNCSIFDIVDMMLGKGRSKLVPKVVNESTDSLVDETRESSSSGEQSVDKSAPARNYKSSKEDKVGYAKDLLQKAKDTGDADIAWELIDFLHDTMLLDDVK